VDRQLHASSRERNPQEVADFFDTAMQLGVEGITVSPGYSYRHAPRRMCFSGAARASSCFARSSNVGRGRRTPWSFNHSALFLDFLAGNQSYQCTPWSTRHTTSSAGSGLLLLSR